MGDHHTAGTLVWVNDSQAGWIKGEVQKMEDKKLKVRTEKGAVGLYKPEDCPLQNPMSRMGVEVSFDKCNSSRYQMFSISRGDCMLDMRHLLANPLRQAGESCILEQSCPLYILS